MKATMFIMVGTKPRKLATGLKPSNYGTKKRAGVTNTSQNPKLGELCNPDLGWGLASAGFVLG